MALLLFNSVIHITHSSMPFIHQQWKAMLRQVVQQEEEREKNTCDSARCINYRSVREVREEESEHEDTAIRYFHCPFLFLVSFLIRMSSKLDPNILNHFQVRSFNFLHSFKVTHILHFRFHITLFKNFAPDMSNSTVCNCLLFNVFSGFISSTPGSFA